MKSRWCKVGDVIRTVRVIENGQDRGSRLRVRIKNSESCAHGNELIAAGRWEVEPERNSQ